MRNLIFSMTLISMLSGVQVFAMNGLNTADLTNQICELAKVNDLYKLKVILTDYCSETVVTKETREFLSKILNPVDRCSPLYYAVKNDNLQMVNFLVENGANVHLKMFVGRYVRTLVHLAKSFEMVKYICISIANPVSIDAGIPGSTALDLALEADDKDKITILVQCYELLLEMGKVTSNQIAKKFEKMRLGDVNKLCGALKKSVIASVLGEPK